MIYRVRARLRPGTEAGFLRRLTDGSVERQKPDGEEIVESMQRAVITEAGEVVWTETCYCDSPLAHERETVLDHYFEGLTTEPVQDHVHYPGTPLMRHLREVVRH
jgi:hypothetical protein